MTLAKCLDQLDDDLDFIEGIRVGNPVLKGEVNKELNQSDFLNIYICLQKAKSVSVVYFDRETGAPHHRLIYNI